MIDFFVTYSLPFWNASTVTMPCTYFNNTDTHRNEHTLVLQLQSKAKLSRRTGWQQFYPDTVNCFRLKGTFKN